MDSLIWIQAALMQNIVNGFFAAVGLGLVIFFHELGHFAVAKWCDVYVERFSIGFGPVIFGWKWGETEYVLSAIPFGGYVKMLGQDDSDPSQLTNEELAADPRSYSAKPVWQRMAIISAGVTMNVITAMIFFTIAYLNGVPSHPAIVGGTSPGSPAWMAGIEPGDRIERINGYRVNEFNDVTMRTALSDNLVRLEGKRRDGVTPFDVTMEPFTHKTHPSITRPQIGVGPTLSLKAESSKKGESPAMAGSAASRAQPSFESGDQIVEINGHAVSNFSDFQHQMAGRATPETEIVVERKHDDQVKRVPIKIDADYFRTLGLRMDCSPITAIQEGSPAAAAGLKVGDKLLQVNGQNLGTDLDPLKLPSEFAHWAGKPIDVRVKRQKSGGGTEEITTQLTPSDRPGWLEAPYNPGEPLTIPAIGVAYHIIPKVVSVEPGSAGEEAGIKPEARITSLRFDAEPDDQQREEKPAKSKSFLQSLFSWFSSGKSEEQNSEAFSLDDPKDPRKENSWAALFWHMQNRKGTVTLTVQQGTETKTVTLTPKADLTWIYPLIGLKMRPLREELKAKSIPEALELSWNFTGQTAVSIYMTLRSLTVTQRLSIKELHGPIGIASATMEIASRSVAELLHFLGLLSVNLAVLNFLPIPVLDGGHMVFLIWEGVTRRKPSERVVVGATYVGLLFILSLTCLVLYVDLSRVFSLGRWF